MTILLLGLNWKSVVRRDPDPALATTFAYVDNKLDIGVHEYDV